MKKQKKKLEQGFTLVELLLVMAIIGILAAAITISIGSQRQRARAMAALETVRSAMADVADCYMKNRDVQAPAVSGGNDICSPSNGIVYPKLGDGTTSTGCAYDASAGNEIVVKCENDRTITCSYENEVKCEVNF